MSAVVERTVKQRHFYECCGQVAHFQADVSKPVERYRRRCNLCGRKWVVVRRQSRPSPVVIRHDFEWVRA